MGSSSQAFDLPDYEAQTEPLLSPHKASSDAAPDSPHKVSNEAAPGTPRLVTVDVLEFPCDVSHTGRETNGAPNIMTSLLLEFDPNYDHFLAEIQSSLEMVDLFRNKEMQLTGIRIHSGPRISPAVWNRQDNAYDRVQALLHITAKERKRRQNKSNAICWTILSCILVIVLWLMAIITFSIVRATGTAKDDAAST